MIPAGVLLVVYVLCVHRVTRLVTTDTITEPGRDWIHRRAYATLIGTQPWTGQHVGESIRVKSRFWAWVHDLVTCDWCSSIWVAAGCACGWKFAGSWFNLVAAVLAASSAAAMLRERVG